MSLHSRTRWQTRMSAPPGNSVKHEKVSRPGIPLSFKVDDFGAAVDQLGEFVITAHLVFGDGAVDHVVDGQAGEGENSIQAFDDDPPLQRDRWRWGGEIGIVRRVIIENPHDG